MDKTDEQLIFEFQQGDTSALELLFERYKGQIFNFALRLTRNRAGAEDATSETFLALFKKAYTLDPTATFKTWLFTIARNCCISQFRKSKNMTRMWSQHNEEEQQWDIPDQQDLPSEKMQKHEQRERVRNAINTLPSGQKDAIILREYHKLSYAEIAEVLGCTTDKVKIFIFRAREHLRAVLLSQDEGSL